MKIWNTVWIKRFTPYACRSHEMCLVLEICLGYSLLFLFSGTNPYKKHSRLQLQQQRRNTVQKRRTADQHLPGTFSAFAICSFSSMSVCFFFPSFALFDIFFLINVKSWRIPLLMYLLPIPKEAKFRAYCSRRPLKKLSSSAWIMIRLRDLLARATILSASRQYLCRLLALRNLRN